ncbi:MAG: hypothetical protein FJ202_07435 [Gemmatimonadetes bacterium]|nr:hypothetical protein [Gemmatimonadota bacterium]
MAVGALPRVADAALIGGVLDRFPHLPPVVRRFTQDALQQTRALAEPALISRLTEPAHSRALAHWVALAATLRLPGALAHVDALMAHDDARVRRAVARALAERPAARTVASLRVLLADSDPDVRAAAARSLGHLAAPGVVADLRRAVHDRAYAVRYNSCLALAQLGEDGRSALQELQGDADRFVADMATVISGLTDGALTELVSE